MNISNKNKKILTIQKILQYSLFNFQQQLKNIRNQFHFKVSLKYCINNTNLKNIQQFARKAFIYFVLVRLKPLIIQQDPVFQQKISKQLKEEYINIYLNYQMHKDAAINLLTVLTGLLITNIIKTILPEIDFTERIRYDIFHVIIQCTLGILVGDASIKMTLNKYLKNKKSERLTLKNKLTLDGSFNRRITNKQINNEKDIFIEQIQNNLKVEHHLLPILEKKKLESYEDQKNQQQQIIKDNTIKKMKKMRLYSNQVSTALLQKTHNSQQNFLPFIKPSLIPCTSEFNPLHYKKVKLQKKISNKIEDDIIINVQQPQNKKNLGFWKKQVQKLRQVYSKKHSIIEQESSGDQEHQQNKKQQSENINGQTLLTETVFEKTDNSLLGLSKSVPIIYRKQNPISNIDISIEMPQKLKTKQKKVSHIERIAQLKHSKQMFEKSCLYNKSGQQIDLFLHKSKILQKIR